MNIRNPIAATLVCLILAAVAMSIFMVPHYSHADPTDGINDGCTGLLTGDQVVVYYFHRKFRCPSCLIVESALNETMREHFSAEFRDGRLAMCVVNLDEADNKGYIDEFDILFNSVIVVERKGGRALRFKNMEKIWEIYQDRNATIRLIKDEVDPFLLGG